MFVIEDLPENCICAELGVLNGDHSEQINSITKPKELTLIDSWEPYDMNYKIKNNTHGPQWMDYITSLETCNIMYNTVVSKFKNDKNINIIRKSTNLAAEDFSNEYFDWIYIDAGHYYENVLEDLETWFPKVKKGGYILGHDFDKQMKSNRYEVREAVEEFVNKHNLKVKTDYFRANQVEFLIKIEDL